MDPRCPESRLFKSLLNENKAKLVLNETQDGDEYLYVRKDVQKENGATATRSSFSAAAVRKR